MAHFSAEVLKVHRVHVVHVVISGIYFLAAPVRMNRFSFDKKAVFAYGKCPEPASIFHFPKLYGPNILLRLSCNAVHGFHVLWNVQGHGIRPFESAFVDVFGFYSIQQYTTQNRYVVDGCLLESRWVFFRYHVIKRHNMREHVTHSSPSLSTIRSQQGTWPQ